MGIIKPTEYEKGFLGCSTRTRILNLHHIRGTLKLDDFKIGPQANSVTVRPTAAEDCDITQDTHLAQLGVKIRGRHFGTFFCID